MLQNMLNPHPHLSWGRAV